MRVVVVGQGYVGLPLAVRAAEVGHEVVAYDIDEARIKRLLSGQSYIEDIPDELLGLFERMAWPEADPELAVRGASQGVRVDVAARMRGMWR